MTWVTAALSLNVVRFSVFELTVSMGQTDGRTDSQRSVTRNAVSYRKGLHDNYNNDDDDNNDGQNFIYFYRSQTLQRTIRTDNRHTNTTQVRTIITEHKTSASRP